MKKYPYQIQTVPNPDVIIVHTRELMPRGDSMDLLSFEIINSDPIAAQKRHPLFNALSNIPGLEKASSHAYEVQLEKTKLYSWEEIIPAVIEAIKLNIADGAPMEEVKAKL